MNKQKPIFLLLFLMMLIMLLISSCTKSKNKELDIVINNTEIVSKVEQDTKPFKIALATGISPESNIEYYWALVKFIENQLGRKVEIVQRQNYAEINYLLSLNLVDVALICSSSYLLAKEDFNIELLVVPKIYGEYNYQSYIIVKESSEIREFAQLKDKRFAFSDPMSTTGYYYPAYRITEYGSNPHDFFSRFFFSYSHDNSIYAVLNGLADGAAIDSTVYYKVIKNNPEISKNIRIIEKSPKFMNSPIVARSNLDENLKEEFIKLFLSVNENENFKNIFAKFDIEGYKVEPNPEKSYENVYQLINEVREKYENNL
ncbi:MAG: phosphate/phosphite/phosphonate ABC transporter substrate-binding protein [Bacillota bacterium]